MKPKLLTALFFIFSSASANAELSLHGLFGDHLVLQRGRRTPVWGGASAGSVVTVSFGGKEFAAVADGDGKWSLRLDPMPAESRGRPLTVSSSLDKQKLSLQDVVVGEVWLCAGEAGMAWPVRAADDADRETAAASFAALRFFPVERRTAEQPKEEVLGAWTVCSPESVASFSAVAYAFGRELHQALGVPVGLILAASAGAPAEAWVSREALEEQPLLRPMLAPWEGHGRPYLPETISADFHEQLEKWNLLKREAETEGRPAPPPPKRIPDPARHAQRPASVYNGMIHPLVPFGLGGVLWRQGESNLALAGQYRTLFPVLIRSWRETWDQGDFPFYFAQLGAGPETAEEAGTSRRAELRESQRLSGMQVPKTGMAVTFDLGAAGGFGTKNEREVGRRLARWALAGDYEKNIVPSGPLYRSMTVKGGRVELEFDTFGSGLRAGDGEPLKGFAVAGEDGNFVPAGAKIVDDRVEVWSPAVPKPVAVRYAWADRPEGNLQNQESLPASPFRAGE